MSVMAFSCSLHDFKRFPVRHTQLLILASALSVATLACHREEGVKVKVADPAAPKADAPSPSGSTLASGPVAETMDASSYTYVRIKTDKGDIWAAGPMTPIKVGEKVSLTLDMPMADFHSSTLNRTFPTIYFTSHIFKEGELTTAPAAH